MPRTAVTPRALVANGGLNGATGATTIDSTLVTNGVVINAAEPERTVLRVTNTEGSTNVVTVRAGDYPPALAAGQGDLTVTVAATTGVQYLGPFESGRVLQGNGTMEIDFETGMTGAIDALLLPKGV
jgi:threonine dehydratase